jgi:transcriptional regulator with XRE-family HTH domain
MIDVADTLSDGRADFACETSRAFDSSDKRKAPCKTTAWPPTTSRKGHHMSGDNKNRNLEELDQLKRVIGQRLRNVRVARKISLKKISYEMDLSYQSVWKYEEGISDIPLSRLLRYCQIVKISSDKIFAGLVSTVVPEISGQLANLPLVEPTSVKSELRTRAVDQRMHKPPRNEPESKLMSYRRQISPQYSLLTFETVDTAPSETGTGKAASDMSDSQPVPFVIGQPRRPS